MEEKRIKPDAGFTADSRGAPPREALEPRSSSHAEIRLELLPSNAPAHPLLLLTG